jgi:hypothetical protein
VAHLEEKPAKEKLNYRAPLLDVQEHAEATFGVKLFENGTARKSTV